MTKKIGLSWVALLAALGVSGCVIEVTFDPIGQDATVAGSWTIDGAAPTEASCAALGITDVRVRFYDGALWVDHPDLVFPCAQGSFDTSPEAVVADGQWTMALVAVNRGASTGDVDVAMGPQQTVDTLAVGGHIALTPINFMGSAVTALAGSWTINGATPTEASCTELGATEVHVQFLDDAGAPDPTSTLKLPCADGSFLQELQPGDYTVRRALVDASSGVLAMEEPQAVTITEGMTTNLPAVDFASAPFNPEGTDSILKATWLIGGSDAPMADQCAAVGGAEVDLVFYAPTDTERADGVAFPLGACDTGTFDSTTAVLAAGDYVVEAILYDATDGIVSEHDFGEVTVTGGTELSLGPVDFRLQTSQVRFFMSWDEPLSGTPSACVDAGVTAMLWRIDYDDGSTAGVTVADGGGETACIPSAGHADATLEAGTYRIYYEGSRTATSSGPPPTTYLKNWEVQAPCEATLDAAGGLAIAYCDAAYSTL